MRTKLLRAMAHIRAATYHLEQARSLVNSDWDRDPETGFPQLMGLLQGVRGAVSKIFGEQSYWDLPVDYQLARRKIR